MKEDHLHPDDKRLLDQQMKSISSLTLFSDKNDLPKIRERIVTLAGEYNRSVLNVSHVVYRLLSSGVDGSDTLRALQLVMELAHDAEIPVLLAEQVLMTLTNGGLMRIEQSAEKAKRILINLARREFQLPDEPKTTDKEKENETENGLAEGG